MLAGKAAALETLEGKAEGFCMEGLRIISLAWISWSSGWLRPIPGGSPGPIEATAEHTGLRNGHKCHMKDEV